MEQLYSDDGKDEMKQYVYDQYVYDVFQRINHTVEYCFELRHSFDSF